MVCSDGDVSGMVTGVKSRWIYTSKTTSGKERKNPVDGLMVVDPKEESKVKYKIRKRVLK